MPYIDPNQKKKLPLPLGVTTGPPGTYTAGAPPILSRSAPTGPRAPSRVDFSGTPALQRIGQNIQQFVGNHGNPLLPAPPSTGRYTQSNVGQNRQPALAPPAGTTGISVIPAAQARPMIAPAVPLAGPTQADMTAESALGQSNLQPPLLPTNGAPGALPRVGETQNVYGIAGINRYDDASGIPTFTNKGQQGYAEIQGMPDTPALSGARAPDFATPASSGGGGFSVVGPGLFSGISQESQQALNEARQAAEARGDYAAVERSYQSPAERAQADATKAEGRLLKRLPGLPAAQVPAALTSLGGQRKPLTFDQVKAARAAQLGQGEPTAADKLLFGQRAAPLAQPRVYTRKSVDEAGTETNLPYTLDAQGNAVPVKFPGAPGQGQPAPQPLPEGHTPESARANAVAIAKETPTRLAEINQLLQGYGLPPIAEADLR